MRIGIILGTRPEIIKLSPVIRECSKRELDYFIIHTNQHYSDNLDKIFFKELELPDPKYNLNIGSGNHGDQTGRMLIEIEKVLIKEKPDIVLVQGDTNTVLSGTLSSVKMGIKVGHVEAGLRSYDRAMPEEVNRVITDHVSDYLFVPTINQKKILEKEGISNEKIFLTGNTIVDSILQNLELSKKKSQIINNLGLTKEGYFLITLHRPSNVDDKNNLLNIFETLKKVYIKYNKSIIFPIHPRTKKMMELYNISIPNGIKIIDPVGYLDFLLLEANSKIILTDSGGVQEEACVLRIPCITLRENTERPETLEVGANILTEINSDKILSSIEKMFNKEKNWDNPFGNGNASIRIINIIQEKLK